MSNFQSELQVLIKRRDIGFYSALIDLVNVYCEEGEYAETLIGQMERCKVRLLIAAEKVSEKDYNDKAKKASQVMAREGMTKDTPKGINPL